MGKPHFVRASQPLLCAFCGLFALGCVGGCESKPAVRPATAAAKTWKLAAQPWTPPTAEVIPADLDPKIGSLIEKTFSDNWAERADAADGLKHLGDRALPSIPFLIRLLGDPELGGARRSGPSSAALGALRHLGKPAIPHLIAALRADNPEIRVCALWLLNDTADPRVADAIMRALDDPHPKVRCSAANGLGRMRENRAVEGLIALLDDRETFDENPSQPVADAAIRALGVIKDTRAVEPLIVVLGDRKRHKSIREMGAWSLGSIGDVRASEALLARAKDLAEDVDIRTGAAHSLAKLRDPRAFDVLKPLVRSKDIVASGSAISGLGWLADERSVQLLTELLDTERTYEAQGEIAFALVRTDKPAAIDALIAAVNRALESNERVGVGEKKDALTLSSNPRAYSWAIDALSKEDKGLRAGVVRALAEGTCWGDIWVGQMDTGPDRRAQALKEPKIVDPLIAIAKDPDAGDTVRENAIIALRKTEDPRALEFLKTIEAEKAADPPKESDQ